LIGLLVPAVQQVREAANRADCGNNLKQIGVALHNYHDVNKTFPSGHQTILTASGQRIYFANWSLLILPYVEQGNLWKQYDNTQSNVAAVNGTVRTTFVKTYTCASDINANKILAPETGADDGTPQFMTGSYRGMAGRTCTPADQWAGYYDEALRLMAKC